MEVNHLTLLDSFFAFPHSTQPFLHDARGEGDILAKMVDVAAAKNKEDMVSVPKAKVRARPHHARPLSSSSSTHQTRPHRSSLTFFFPSRCVFSRGKNKKTSGAASDVDRARVYVQRRQKIERTRRRASLITITRLRRPLCRAAVIASHRPTHTRWPRREQKR